MSRSRRPLAALGVITLALICSIVGTDLIFLHNLRENTLQTAEANLARYSLTLAENADRSFKSLDLVLSSVGDYLARKGVRDSASYRRLTSDREIHFLLKEKIDGLPQVDAGIGIAKDKIGLLFVNFVQADNSISRRFGGSGLGLAICRRLVEQMGGEIKVTSTPGRGSTFSFKLTLPLAENVALPDQNDQVAYDKLSARIAAFGRPLRALIVDDNPTNRLVATRMLKEFDVQTDTACDGTEAVTAARRFNYDVILMDVRMPEMDGLQATRIIRSRGEHQSDVPIIAFTANAFPEDIEACRKAGMNDFVVKPARKKAMVEAILRALPGPLEATEALAENQAPSLAPEQATPANAVLVLDREVFRELVREIGEQAASEIHAVFVAETESRLKLLRGLSIEQEGVKIGREAHSLKSSAGTFGYRALAGLALRLEREAQRLAEGEYRALLDQMDAAYLSAAALEPQD